MRTSRYIFYTALATIMALLYVFQQTEIVKLGYGLTSFNHELQRLQDRRTSLEFILSSLESPANLDKNAMFNQDQFEMARTYKLVKLPASSSAAQSGAIGADGKKEFSMRRFAFHSLFAPKQAEAKTLK